MKIKLELFGASRDFSKDDYLELEINEKSSIKDLKIDNIKLLVKEGGKSGLWTNPDGLPEFLKNIF